MTNVSSKFSRKLLCLAVAGACVRSAVAGPAAPVVNAGHASYDPATLTVTSTTAHTQINWRSFNVAAGEVVNFVQPNAQSSVLNQVFNPQALNILGSLKSNASVLFMSNGSVSGPGVKLDLAGMVSTSLRLPDMAPALSGVETLARARPLATLAGGRIYVISQDEQAVTVVEGEVVLHPGKRVELTGAATPRLRVELFAPEAESINLSRLVAGKGETGMFAGLFKVPAAARQAVQRDAGAVLTASADIQGRVLERFYRYDLMYARLRDETRQPAGGVLQVAAAPTSKAMLPAIRSRLSVLPRDIEIGAPRSQELALRPASLPLSAEAEPASSLPQRQAASVAEQSEAQTDDAPVLAYVAAEPPADAVATPASQPVMVAVASAAQPDSAPLLAYVAVEPPAESVATRNPPLAAVAAQSLAQSDSAPALVFAAVEPPAEFAPARPAQKEAESAPGRLAPSSSPTVVVVALAQHTLAAAPREEAAVKEVRIERRAPRYFTDYRGAMFFM